MRLGILLLICSTSASAAGFLTVKNSSWDTILVEEGVIFKTKEKVLSGERITLPIANKINDLKIRYKSTLGFWADVPNCPQGDFAQSSMDVHVVSWYLQAICEK